MQARDVFRVQEKEAAEVQISVSRWDVSWRSCQLVALCKAIDNLTFTCTATVGVDLKSQDRSQEHEERCWQHCAGFLGEEEVVVSVCMVIRGRLL